MYIYTPQTYSIISERATTYFGDKTAYELWAAVFETYKHFVELFVVCCFWRNSTTQRRVSAMGSCLRFGSNLKLSVNDQSIVVFRKVVSHLGVSL